MKHYLMVVVVVALIAAPCAAQPAMAQRAALTDYEILPFSQHVDTVSGETRAEYRAWKIDRKKKTIQQCAIAFRISGGTGNEPMPKMECRATITVPGLQTQSAATLHQYLPPSAHLQAPSAVWLIDATTGVVSLCSFNYGPSHPGCYSE